MNLNNKIIRTVLLDLDGTLITVDWRRDMKMYFKMVQEILKDYGLKPTYFIAVRRAAYAMMRDKNGGRINLDKYFHYLDKFSKADVSVNRDLYWTFYRKFFNDFRMGVNETAGAHDLMSLLKRKKKTLVLATNPVFPLEAVKERLAWGNIDSDDFSLITNIKYSHYCKPNRNYYSEILKTIDSTPDECLMVGDDYRQDIKPARSLGMQVWWCKPIGMFKKKGIPSGNLSALIKALRE